MPQPLSPPPSVAVPLGESGAAGDSPLPWPGGLRLNAGEAVLATGRFDLDASLRFSDGWIVLTNKRVLADQPASGSGELSGRGPFAWSIGPQTRLDVHLRSAVGRVELSAGDRVVARWLFTPARADAIHALEDAFDARVAGPDGLTEPASGAVRPAASASDDTADADPKPAPIGRGLADDAGGQASWRALFRLIAFARPHAGMAILGGLLSLASTAAALVPPYLTMPLVDQVLIPRQNGADVPFGVVWWYLGGLLAAALAAWLLSWAQTWVLGWVSERIAAGLRTRTYAHMQMLSLDFFQGKRTGDLMSRVGSDTDKINVFLSVNLIDFASNVMLLALTAAVLIWLNPTLALLTLVPFPFV
ncbi:MAG: ABC transporter transmembrane domain-containing protein, partial [Planctomycetota bacterium]